MKFNDMFKWGTLEAGYGQANTSKRNIDFINLEINSDDNSIGLTIGLTKSETKKFIKYLQLLLEDL